MFTPPSSDLSALPWDRPSPHLQCLTVGAQHIDLMQHTNNVNYLQWVEDMAWSHSRALGLGPEEYAALGHGMVVHRHTLHYLQPTRLGERLALGTWLVAADRLTLQRAHQFVRVADGQTVFRALTDYVCVDIAQGRVRRMPPAFVQAYGAALAATPPTSG